MYNFRMDRPIYIQIMELVKRRIVRGEYVGSLPTVRELALELEVNPNTVARAYRELEREGIIRARVGSGSFVNEEKVEELKKELVKEAFEEFLLSLKELGLEKEKIKEILEGLYD